MGTYHYETLHNYPDLKTAYKNIPSEYTLVGLDNRPGAIPLPLFEWPSQPLIVLGNEGTGFDSFPELPYYCKYLVSIPQAGSVRSMNVACAYAIAAYDLCWKKGWIFTEDPKTAPPMKPKKHFRNDDIWG